MIELTLEITSKCEHGCDYCSTNATPEGKNIHFNDVSGFLNKYREQDIQRINISGGEPLSHPDFYQILRYCEKFTENVWVYTNALRQIKFNSDIIKEIKIEANVCIITGRSSYIPKNVDKVNLLKLVHQGRAKQLPKNPQIHVSGNFVTSEHTCESCNHALLQANGKIVDSPCKKDYPSILCAALRREE